MKRLDTGTGVARRRMTLEEAQAGYSPDPFTAQEWLALWRAAQTYPLTRHVFLSTSDGHLSANVQPRTAVAVEATWGTPSPFPRHPHDPHHDRCVPPIHSRDLIDPDDDD